MGGGLRHLWYALTPPAAGGARFTGVVRRHALVALLLVRRQPVPAPPRLQGDRPDTAGGLTHAGDTGGRRLGRHQRDSRWSTNSTMRCESWITSSPSTNTGAQRWPLT